MMFRVLGTVEWWAEKDRKTRSDSNSIVLCGQQDKHPESWEEQSGPRGTATWFTLKPCDYVTTPRYKAMFMKECCNACLTTHLLDPSHHSLRGRPPGDACWVRLNVSPKSGSGLLRSLA
jgi:hypothetical protein